MVLHLHEERKMEIEFTRIDTEYACDELARSLMMNLPDIIRVAMEFKDRNTPRKLVVILGCDCCSMNLDKWSENPMFVTPFKGACSDRVTRISVYPPIPGRHKADIAVSKEEFLKQWRETIERALS